jgi:hypothetical protein
MNIALSPTNATTFLHVCRMHYRLPRIESHAKIEH